MNIIISLGLIWRKVMNYNMRELQISTDIKRFFKCCVQYAIAPY